MSRWPWATGAAVFRRTALPLASYYVVTLALPLANGAARSNTAFLKHALVVLVVPLAAIVLTCAVCRIAQALGGALAHEDLPSFTKSPAVAGVCDRPEPARSR